MIVLKINQKKLNSNNFLLYPYTEYELYHPINDKLNNSSSSGADGIPNFLVKKVIHNIVKLLTYLVDLLFWSVVFLIISSIYQKFVLVRVIPF